MSRNTFKIVLWIGFTALFFIIFCGVSYLMSGDIDLPNAIFFFVLMLFIDKQGIPYLVDHFLPEEK